MTSSAALFERERRGRRPLAGFLALAVYTALAFLLFSSTWVAPQRRYIGGGGDPELFTWLLGWTQFAITHGHNLFLSDFLNYPTGANLMWSPDFTLPGLVAWPVWATMGPLVAYNLVFTMALALSAWAAYLALARLVRSRLAAGVGGLLYGFSPYILPHALGHANFVLAIFPPIALLLMHELLVLQAWRPWFAGGLLGFASAAQLLTGEEILATTVLIAMIGTIVIALVAPSRVRPHLRHAAIGLVTAAVVGVLLSAYPLYIQFFGSQRPPGAVRPPDTYVNDLLTFFIPSPIFLISPSAFAHLSAKWSGGQAEWNGYIGIPLTVLLLGITIRGWRSPLIRWAALMGFLIALLSLGPHLHLDGKIRLRVQLPWLLVQNLPIFRDILPARLSMYFFLVAAVAIAWYIDRVDLNAARRPRAAGWAALVIALLPLVPRLPWPTSERPVPDFFHSSAIAAIPDGSVALVAPFSIEGGDVDPQVWQATADYRFRMPSGYVLWPAQEASATRDAMLRIESGQPVPEMTPDLRQAMVADFAHWGVRTVIVGPMAHEDGEVQLFTELLGRGPEDVDGVAIWRNVQPT